MDKSTLFKNHPAVTSAADMRDICGDLFRNLGLNYFSHAIYYQKTSGFTALVTLEDAFLYWINNQYSMMGSNKNDPPLKSGYYFLPHLTDVIPSEYLRNLSNLFHIDHMLVYIDVHPDHYESFAFATSPENENVIHTYFNNIPVLNKFIVYYKQRAKKIIHKANQNLLLIPRLEYASNDLASRLNTPLAFSEQFKSTLKNLSLGSLTSHGNQIYLSEQEAQCLMFRATGKNTKACADAMGLSARTVESYIEKIKLKLSVYSLSEAIDIFWQHHEITPTIK